jgi:hypothetical protein
MGKFCHPLSIYVLLTIVYNINKMEEINLETYQLMMYVWLTTLLVLCTAIIHI